MLILQIAFISPEAAVGDGLGPQNLMFGDFDRDFLNLRFAGRDPS